MSELSRMVQRLLLVLLLGGGMTLWAQTDEQEPIDPESPEQQEVEGEEAPPETTPGQEVADSPFDYQSSEEISEDLSVSFPVDI
jgi:hypothetical protein